MLAVKDIRIGYRSGELILEDLGFSLAPGQMLAILGPNGVGKTTLLRCLNAMLKPWSGSVRVLDLDVFQAGPAEIAKNLGYVAQRHEAGRMTAFDTVLLGRKAHLRSRLAEIPGVGPGRRRALLRHFGSLAKIRTATVSELARAPGISRPVARTIHRFLQAQADDEASPFDS